MSFVYKQVTVLLTLIKRINDLIEKQAMIYIEKEKYSSDLLYNY